MSIFQTYSDLIEKYWAYPSFSEWRFFQLLSNTDTSILSVWMSTWWYGEAILAQVIDNVQIVATTIDKQWLESSLSLFDSLWIKNILWKIEDVWEINTYEDESFDIINARLVLHYLDVQRLRVALSELYRVLKKDWKIFVVVRSEKNIVETKNKTYNLDQISKLTTVSYLDDVWEIIVSSQRFFHSVDSIASELQDAWFVITSQNEYEERLCQDYARNIPSNKLDHLIEIVACK